MILHVASGWNNLNRQTPNRTSKVCFSGGDMPEFRDICCPSVTDVQPLAEAGSFPLPERHQQEMHKPTGKVGNK